ncbi:MAG: hypothetical protein ABIW47_03065 [Ginsengibacter sp.]|jgi:hypothetical protein
MKAIFVLTVFIFLFSVSGFSQDSAKFKVLQKVNVKKKNPDPAKKNYTIKLNKQPQIMYRDTRLGSSSPLYKTYKKNDYGAGAITTNPNKSDAPSFIYTSPVIKTDTLKHKPDSIIHH